MTTDELERDLRTLAAPREADERLHLDLREQLRARPQHRGRTSPALGAAALAAVAVAAVVAVLVGTGKSGGPATADAAILTHVNRALTPPANFIVHVKEAGRQNGTPVGVEWWQETSAPHALRVIKSFGDYASEGADDGTTSAWYDPSTNTISQRPAPGHTVTLIDPIQTVRSQLRDGTAHVAGTVTIDGRALYKIALPTGAIAYFDQTDYRPVYLDNPQRNGEVVRTQVVTYEELPLTPENEQLLSLTAQHPRATVETGPAKE